MHPELIAEEHRHLELYKNGLDDADEARPTSGWPKAEVIELSSVLRLRLRLRRLRPGRRGLEEDRGRN